MNTPQEIDASTLHAWLTSGKKVTILDIRPLVELFEYNIPGSIHADMYGKIKMNDPSAFDQIYLDKSVPVVAVCAGGKTSLIAAYILSQKGYNAYTLSGGIKGWNESNIEENNKSVLSS